MDKSNDSTMREATPPSPPRWRGTQSLGLVYQLNERCIDLLCDLAMRSASETTLQIVTANRDLWIRLSVEARSAMARLPFLIIDANFRDEMWWRKAAEQKSLTVACDERCDELPRELAEQLMHETTMFAWQTARWDRTVAQLSLGMTAGVVAIIAALTPQQIRIIATTQSEAVQVRWAHDLQFWRELLAAANANDEGKLNKLHLHAKLRLCGEIAQLRFDRQ